MSIDSVLITLNNGKQFSLQAYNQVAKDNLRKYHLDTNILCNGYLTKTIAFDNGYYHTKNCFCYKNVKTNSIVKATSIKSLIEQDDFKTEFTKAIKQDTAECAACPAFNNLNCLDISTILNLYR